MNKPTHKHTHLQATQSQRTNQSLQKSVLFANAKRPDRQSQPRKGAADNKQIGNRAGEVLLLNFCTKLNDSNSIQLLC